MSKIKNTGLDQYGAESFEQQQFGTAGAESVNSVDGERMFCENMIRKALDTDFPILHQNSRNIFHCAFCYLLGLIVEYCGAMFVIADTEHRQRSESSRRGISCEMYSLCVLVDLIVLLIVQRDDADDDNNNN